MYLFEGYQERFEKLASRLREASSLPITQELKQELVDTCADIEFVAKQDIALLLEQFKEIEDAQLIVTATFLGMVRDIMHYTAYQIIGCWTDFSALENLADGSTENLIFATKLMICNRDGKDIRCISDNTI